MFRVHIFFLKCLSSSHRRLIQSMLSGLRVNKWKKKEIEFVCETTMRSIVDNESGKTLLKVVNNVFGFITGK